MRFSTILIFGILCFHNVRNGESNTVNFGENILVESSGDNQSESDNSSASFPRYGLLANQLGIPPVPGVVSNSAFSSNTHYPIVTKPPSKPVESSENSVYPVATNLDTDKSQPKPQAIQTTNCECTTVENCGDGAGPIDPRIVNRPVSCPDGQKLCCNVINTIKGCGIGQTIPVPGVYPTFNQANFGEYPWMSVILTNDNRYLGAGALIDKWNVITAAHKVATRPGMKVRFGEWDTNTDIEPYKFVEIAVEQVVVHAEFNNVNLYNDIAILRLAEPLDIGAYPHINSVCMPQQGQTFSQFKQCWVAGFGTDAFSTGKYSTIMRQVDLPIVDSNECEQKFRQTRLGRSFSLNKKSFICAGGVPGKDACTGDGGSPLVCKTGDHYTVVGLVAWGIGCADKGVPGAYVQVSNYVSWIDRNKKK